MILMQIDEKFLIIGIEPNDLEKLKHNESPLIPSEKSGLNKDIALLRVNDRDALEYAAKELAPQASVEVDESFNLTDLQSAMQKHKG